MSEVSFITLLEKCPEIRLETSEHKVYDGDEVQDLEEFWKICPEGLEMRMKFPLNVNSEGNYPDLYRNALWAQDSTGISRDLFIKVCEETIFKRYAVAGYPEHKWYAAIEHVFGDR